MITVDLDPELERLLGLYEIGYIQGLCAYAWWKDGVQYVGTTGTTLKQAISAFLTKEGFPEPHFKRPE